MRKMPNWLGLAWIPALCVPQVYAENAWGQQGGQGVTGQAAVAPSPSSSEPAPGAPAVETPPPVVVGGEAAPVVPAVAEPADAASAPASEEAGTDGVKAELAALRAEIDALKTKQEEAEMAALLAAEPADVEEETYRLYGFMDMGAQYYAVDKSSLVGAVFDTNALTFVTGNIDLYLPLDPSALNAG